MDIAPSFILSGQHYIYMLNYSLYIFNIQHPVQSGFYNLGVRGGAHLPLNSYSEYPRKSLLFNLAFNTGFEPVETVSTAHGKSAPGLEYFTQARDRSP